MDKKDNINKTVESCEGNDLSFYHESYEELKNSFPKRNTEVEINYQVVIISLPDNTESIIIQYLP